MDSMAKMNGWTHRIKRKSREPYVKLAGDMQQFETGGITVIDMDQKFRWIPEEELVEL